MKDTTTIPLLTQTKTPTKIDEGCLVTPAGF